VEEEAREDDGEDRRRVHEQDRRGDGRVREARDPRGEVEGEGRPGRDDEQPVLAVEAGQERRASPDAKGNRSREAIATR